MPSKENKTRPDVEGDVNTQMSLMSTGLPTFSDINDTLITLDWAPKFLLEEKVPTLRQSISYNDPESIRLTEEEYGQYRLEFAEDVNDFHVRLQRLKIKMLTYLLGGRYIQPCHRENPDNFKGIMLLGMEKPIMEVEQYVNSLCYCGSEGDEKLIDGINSLLPSDMRLRCRKGLFAEDVRLVSQLLSSFSSRTLLGDDRIARLQILFDRLMGLEDKIVGIGGQGELFAKCTGGFLNEHVLAQCWDEYRLLLKEFATFEELSSWISPAYDGSNGKRCGDFQLSNSFRGNYQRWEMPELQELERRFGDVFGLKAAVFNSGMNALQAILIYLDNRMAAVVEDEYSPKIFKTKDIYFEVDSVVSGHYKKKGVELKEFDSTDMDSLIQAIREELPSVVFLNPMSNMYNMDVVEVTRLLEALSDKEWKKQVEWGMCRCKRFISIVIDNSTLSELAKWRKFDFSKLPRFVSVISFESLQKFSQDGQEVVQAALVSCSDNYDKRELDDLRAMRGFAPPESTVRRLSVSIQPGLLKKKMMRHSRNAELLGNLIEERIGEDGSFIKEVILPYLPSHSQHDVAKLEMDGGGGLMNLGFNFDFLDGYCEQFIEGDSEGWERVPIEKDDAERFTEYILNGYVALLKHFAKSAKFDLDSGTSYGFNETRLSVCSYNSVPYIRLAVGTENIKDVKAFAQVIHKANKVFMSLIKERTVFSFCAALMGRKCLALTY